MKKLFLVTVIALAAAFSANAQFFFGFQFGGYVDGANDYFPEIDYNLKGGTSFNVTIKPSVGYYFTPKLCAGVKLCYTDCSYNVNDTDVSITNIKYYLDNMLMGNGLKRNCMNWKVSPYVRYNVLSLGKEKKVKLWAELDGYAGQQMDRDPKTHALRTEETKTIYGIQLHPIISLDITRNRMLFTSLDILSFGWNGTSWKTQVKQTDGTYLTCIESQNSAQFVLMPLYALNGLFVNIGMVKIF